MKWAQLTQSWRAQGYHAGLGHGILLGVALALIVVWVTGCGSMDSAVMAVKAHESVAPELDAFAADVKTVEANGAAVVTEAGAILKVPDLPAEATQRAGKLSAAGGAIGSAVVSMQNTMTAARTKDTSNVATAKQTAEKLVTVTAENAGLKDARSHRMDWLYEWAIAVGFGALLVAAASIALAAYLSVAAVVKPYAVTIAIAGGVAILGGYTMLTFAWLIPYVGAGIVLILAAWYVYVLWQDRKDTKAKLAESKIMTTDLVAGADAIKNPVFDVQDPAGADKAKVNALLRLAQAPATKDAVDAIRAAPATVAPPDPVTASPAPLPAVTATPEAAPIP